MTSLALYKRQKSGNQWLIFWIPWKSVQKNTVTIFFSFFSEELIVVTGNHWHRDITLICNEG